MIASSSGSCQRVCSVMFKSISLPFSRLNTSPWMRSCLPLFQACCTKGVLATLNTCSLTLISTSSLAFSSTVVKLTNACACLCRILLNLDSQASRGPWSYLVTAALTPPQLQCPAMIISYTWRTSTAYWMTASDEMSEGETIFATFLNTKTSPQSKPRISLAGSLESEHPIQRYFGFCDETCLPKNSASSLTLSFAHFLLFSITLLRLLRSAGCLALPLQSFSQACIPISTLTSSSNFSALINLVNVAYFSYESVSDASSSSS